MAHLGSYLFHELTTPLGLRLDRAASSTTPARRACPSAAWAPTASGSRAACCCGWRPAGLPAAVEEWQAAGRTARRRPELEAAEARVLADPELLPEALSRGSARRRRPTWRAPRPTC